MPKKLLLADDSVTIQKVVAITFAAEDYAVTAVDNGEEALAKARELRPDVVLADVVMPKRNGYEVCEALKADPALRQIPVLLLAGPFEAFDEDRARACSADGHIQKPFESQALIDRVNQLVLKFGASAGAEAPLPEVAPAPPQPAAPPPAAPPPAARPPSIHGVPRPPVTLAPAAARPSSAPGVPTGPRPPNPAAFPTAARPPPPGAAGSVRPLQQGGQPTAARAGGLASVPRPPPPGAPTGTRPAAPGSRPPPPGTRPPAPGVPAGVRPPAPGAPTTARPPIPGIPPPPGRAAIPGLPPPPPHGALPTARAARDPFGLGVAAAPRVEPAGGALRAAPAPAAAAEVAPRAPRAAPAADGGEALLREALSKASREVVEKIAWEVVPQLAELIIREELDRLIKEREAKA